MINAINSVLQMLVGGVLVLLGVALFLVACRSASRVFWHAHYFDIVSSHPASSSRIGLITYGTVHYIPFLFKILILPCVLLEILLVISVDTH